MKTIEGKCPRCDRNGAAGSPCQTDGCRVSGVHCIPRGYHERFRQLPEAEREPLIGQRIDDYLLVDTIGEGGFGRLFVTLQLPLFMRCALKLMTVRRDVNEAVLTSMVKKFESEAMNLAQLSHPNIVRIVKYGMFRGLPYIAMEYVDNARTLKHEIRRRIRRNE
ncbi:MAG: hypothetical protein KC609_22765, partial [Myxococcales bacterium]|nr:hypothetical protein [Myxococcales bacterium]